MSSLSQALRLEYLPSAHDAFQGHAAHIIEWPTMLRPKDSEGTCIPSGVPTFLQTASRRSPSADYYDHSVTLGLASRRPSRSSLMQHYKREVGGPLMPYPHSLCGAGPSEVARPYACP